MYFLGHFTVIFFLLFLWWTNYKPETLFLNVLRHIFEMCILLFLVT